MKKLLFLAIIAIGFTSCQQIEGKRTENKDKQYSVIIVDSCEYIECDYGIFDQRVYSLTHKGNCKFCSKRLPEYLK